MVAATAQNFRDVALVTALVHSRLDYCNVVFAGLPACDIQGLQSMHERTVFNVRLTEGSLYNRFGVILGVGAKIFGGKVHPSLELRVFRHPWSRSDAPCSSILNGYSHLP